MSQNLIFLSLCFQELGTEGGYDDLTNNSEEVLEHLGSEKEILFEKKKEFLVKARKFENKLSGGKKKKELNCDLSKSQNCSSYPN